MTRCTACIRNENSSTNATSSLAFWVGKSYPRRIESHCRLFASTDMQIKKDFEYYENLHTLICHALLHLLGQVAQSDRHVPVSTRNEILVRFLKPKLKQRTLANVKKDIRMMIQVARSKSGNLEQKLYLLNTKSNQTKLAGAESLYSLLVYLYDELNVESRLFDKEAPIEPGVLYMLEEHLEHCFDNTDQQVAPLSVLIQSEQASELLPHIEQHGQFRAEMKEWQAEQHQAHILLHPVLEASSAVTSAQ